MIGGAFMGCMLSMAGQAYRRVSSIYQNAGYSAVLDAPFTWINFGVKQTSVSHARCEFKFKPLVDIPSFDTNNGFGIVGYISTLGIIGRQMRMWTTSSQFVTTPLATNKECLFVSDITTNWETRSRHNVFELQVGKDTRRYVIDRTYTTSATTNDLYLSIFASSPNGTSITSGTQACRARSVEFFKAKCWKDGVVVADISPVVRIEDGTAGFMNAVDGNFYGPTNGKGSYGYNE